ncbi:MAG TPA: histidine phosphatase family protein [Dehalococcoidia bacterium]|nr:histidine phosphatase family protein [Dehalococcoidia bacterium]
MARQPGNEAAAVPAGTVYCVRHGLVHNPNRIAYGWLPRYRLAEVGRLQAAATAEYLAGRGIGFVLTSPLLRARQTTSIIAARLPDVPVRRSRLLIESGLARHWQGESWSEIPLNHAAAWELFQNAPGALTLGEPMAAMAARLRRALALALRLSGGRPAVCVSHRDPILALRLAVEGRSFDLLHRTACNPASVTAIESNAGHLRLVEYVEPYAGPAE